MNEPYPIITIEPDWVLEPEGMGSKRKFWYRQPNRTEEWLFKFPQENTGQHWAEKIAEAVAQKLSILHARVELAEFQGARGSATLSFARAGRDLFHGNQILAGMVLHYDTQKQFRQSDHTLENIFEAIQRTFPNPIASHRARAIMASYLVLDAVVGNTDRHHENWGILRRQVGRQWRGMMAPSFDHASSLGRELRDEGPGKSRSRILAENRIAPYAEKARGAIYWQKADKRGSSPLELVRRAARLEPELFRPVLSRLPDLDETQTRLILSRVPQGWMSPLAIEFAFELIRYNVNELRNLEL